jgi:hypothetical protein
MIVLCVLKLIQSLVFYVGERGAVLACQENRNAYQFNSRNEL